MVAMVDSDHILISLSEAARRLGVRHSVVRTWIDKGMLEAYRLEDRPRWRYLDAEAVEAFGVLRKPMGV